MSTVVRNQTIPFFILCSLGRDFSIKVEHRKLHTVRDVLPFCRATPYGIRCPHGSHYIKVKGYPLQPGIGEAIRKRRLDLNLRQVDAAKSIGCNEMTIVNWEKGHTRPRPKKYSAIRTFLGRGQRNGCCGLEPRGSRSIL